MKVLRSIFLALLFAIPSIAQDVNLGPQFTSFTTVTRGAAWSAINNAYIFAPNSQDAAMCLELINNNPTSSHSVTIALNQTHDPSTTQYTGNTGRWVATNTVTPLPISVGAGSSAGIYFQTFGAAQLALVFSGSTTQAGSPDTVDIFIVATKQGNCGIGPGGPTAVSGPYKQGTTIAAANQVPIPIGGYTAPGTSTTIQGYAVGNSGNGFIWEGGVCCHTIGQGFIASTSGVFAEPKATNANAAVQLASVGNEIPITTFGAKGIVGGGVHTDLLEIASDQFNITPGNIPGWVVLGKLTNPATGATLLSQFSTSAAAVNVAYRRLILECSVACELLITKITARGGTCTALVPQSLQLGNNNTALAPVAADVTENACATPPTASTSMFDLPIGAATFVDLDLRGFVNFHGTPTGGGLMVQVVTGITGVATASLEFVEQ